MDNKNDKLLGKLYDMLVREDILKIVQDEKEVHLSTKVERLNKYLEKLKRVQGIMFEGDRLDVLRRMYYNRYIIKEEDIPDSYLKSLEMRYLDEGRGYVNLVNPKTETDRQLRKQHVDSVISEQKSSLDSWLDYLLSPDSDYLEMWAKVWVFQGMLKIGNFDVKKNSYGRRSKVTINPFVSFDSELMGKCVDLVKQNLDGGEPTESELDKLVESGNFAKLYGMMLSNKKKITISSNEGIWVKYNYETNKDVLRKEHDGIEPEYLKLYNSLQGYNTGWCTASSKETAKSQICGSSNYKGGDFYVYYSIDENGEYKIPRIAIRMDRDKIGEIRGIAESQNIESGMEDILEEKLKEFPDSDNYKKRISDMKLLTEMYYKMKEGIDLTKEELRFLYEVDCNISSFGYQKDPRINEIIKTRNKRKDLALVLGCEKDEIGFEKTDINHPLICYYGDLSFIKPIKFCDKKLPVNLYGSLYYNLSYSKKGLELPRYITMDLKLDGRYYWPNELNFPEYVGGNLRVGITSFNNVEIELKYVGGYAYFPNLTCIKSLKFPKKMCGSLYLYCLKKFENLELPERVNGDLCLSEIIDLKGTALPRYVGGYLSLSSLTSADGLVLPEYVGGDIYLRDLVSAKNIVFPQRVGGKLSLTSLTSVDGLVLPEYVGGDLDLRGLTSLKGLKLPEHVGGRILFGSEIDYKDLKLPKELHCGLDIDALGNIKDFDFPEFIDGDLYLKVSSDVQELKLPSHINGSLYLRGILSARGLELPRRISRSLCIDDLISAEGLVLPKRINQNLVLGGLTNARGLLLPSFVGGDLKLSNMLGGKGLVLPKYVGGNLVLSKLRSIKNVVLPEYVGGKIEYKHGRYTLEQLIAFQEMEKSNTINDSDNRIRK